MFPKSARSVIAVLSAGLIVLAPVMELQAQQDQDGQESATISPQSGFFFYSGGPARAKRARTQTTASNIGESSTWVSLPGGVLTYVVPSGTTDLFNVAFSAECRLFNASQNDYLRIRIVDIVGGVTTPLEPYDGGQAFCSANNYATYKGNWVRRVGAGTHTLVVQFWIFDASPTSTLTGRIDDWTFETVVYD